MARTARPSSRQLKAELCSLYREIMWLARRQGVSASDARAWYTHIRAEKLKREIRSFSGKVSEAALNDRDDLRLEHYRRIQTSLTGLVRRHLDEGLNDPDEFITLLLKCECVHIVTREENYAIMRHKGKYVAAGVKLVPWSRIPPEARQYLWKRMLRGRVCNASSFAPEA